MSIGPAIYALHSGMVIATKALGGTVGAGLVVVGDVGLRIVGAIVGAITVGALVWP